MDNKSFILVVKENASLILLIYQTLYSLFPLRGLTCKTKVGGLLIVWARKNTKKINNHVE